MELVRIYLQKQDLVCLQNNSNNYGYILLKKKTHSEKNVDNGTIKEQLIQF